MCGSSVASESAKICATSGWRSGSSRATIRVRCIVLLPVVPRAGMCSPTAPATVRAAARPRLAPRWRPRRERASRPAEYQGRCRFARERRKDTSMTAQPLAPPAPPVGAAPQLPPHARVLTMVSGFRAAQVVYALTELGVADQLAGGPRTVAEIAAATGTHEPSLGRLLRAAAAIGLLEAVSDGRYGPTALSAALVKDSPGSVRDL